MLNASPRNWRRRRSEIGTVRNREKSKLKRPGPLSTLRPMLPKDNAAGTAKLEALNHGWLSPIPWLISMGAIWLGDCELPGACNPVALYVKLSGDPVISVRMPPTRQPPAIAATGPEFNHRLFLPNGRS